MDWTNRVLDFYKNNNIAQDKIEEISRKISDKFYPAPNNSDIADMLYRNYSKGASNIIEMTPDEYLKQAYNTYHYNRPTADIPETYDRFLDRVKRETIAGNTSGGSLLDKIKRGQKLDMLELAYDELGKGMGQEGNHRAMASKLMGIEKIPVAITTYTGDKGIKDALKKNASKALRFGGKILMGVDPWFAIADMLKLQGSYPYSEKEYKSILKDMGIEYDNGLIKL
jgi:hypothetical protein